MTKQELDLILQKGEGYAIEFKRNINSDLSKEITAFANSSGGRIFIGIEDDASISGVHINNDLKSRIQAMASNCDPAVHIELEAFNDILIIHVPEGKDKPYRSTNGFYIRSGPNSVKLSTAEIIEFLKEEGKVRFEDMYIMALDYQTDIDESVLRRFNRLSGISDVVGIKELLINLGVLHTYKGSLTLNNAGILFFAKQPARAAAHAAISCVLFKGNQKVHIIDRKIFEFDLLTNIDQAVAFLERNLKLSYEIKDIRRKEILEIPKDVLREAVINAVAHRDYFEKGAYVVVEIFDDRVEISNPGGLPKGLKPEEFGKRSVKRNPLIAGLLNRCDYIEKAGTGIQRMCKGMREAGLSEPTFEFSGFFVVSFQRPQLVSNVKDKELPVSSVRLERMLAIMRQLNEKGRIDMKAVVEQFETTVRTIRRDLELLEELGYINSTGVTNNTNYSLTKKGLDKLR